MGSRGGMMYGRLWVNEYSQLPDAGRGRGPVSLLQPPERSSADTYSVCGSVELQKINLKCLKSSGIW